MLELFSLSAWSCSSLGHKVNSAAKRVAVVPKILREAFNADSQPCSGIATSVTEYPAENMRPMARHQSNSHEVTLGER